LHITNWFGSFPVHWSPFLPWLAWWGWLKPGLWFFSPVGHHCWNTLVRVCEYSAFQGSCASELVLVFVVRSRHFQVGLFWISLISTLIADQSKGGDSRFSKPLNIMLAVKFWGTFPGVRYNQTGPGTLRLWAGQFLWCTEISSCICFAFVLLGISLSRAIRCGFPSLSGRGSEFYSLALYKEGVHFISPLRLADRIIWFHWWRLSGRVFQGSDG
jgi:hypothetical protein